MEVGGAIASQNEEEEEEWLLQSHSGDKIDFDWELMNLNNGRLDGNWFELNKTEKQEQRQWKFPFSKKRYLSEQKFAKMADKWSSERNWIFNSTLKERFRIISQPMRMITLRAC